MCEFQHSIEDTGLAYKPLQIHSILQNFHFGTISNIIAAKKKGFFRFSFLH